MASRIANPCNTIPFGPGPTMTDGTPLEHSLYFARAESYEFSLTVRGKLPITRSLKTAG